MKLDELQRATVESVGRSVLDGLEQVARLAREWLADPHSPPDPTRVLAVNTNLYVHGPTPAIQQHQAGIAQGRATLLNFSREPFVARVTVIWDGDDSAPQTLYFSRSCSAEAPGIRVLRYLAPLGRLAESEAGQHVTIHTPGGVRKGFVKERVRLRPGVVDGAWDGLDDSLEFEQWSVALDSLRRFLADVDQLRLTEDEAADLLDTLLQQGREASLVRDHLKRRVVDRMSLRDQPILDRYQGDVFRMPLNRRLILLGPPGTGKTTTLIRRLAQKRAPDALLEEETDALSAAGIRESPEVSTWAMFAPTELLKSYLREAFNREAVPASSENLRTWERQRLDLARNTLGILRSAESGRFQLDPSAALLADSSSTGAVRLFEAFAPDFEDDVLARFADALEQLGASDDASLSRRVADVVGRSGTGGRPSIAQLVSVLERSSELQPDLKRIDSEIDDETRRLGRRTLRQHPDLLAEVADRLQEPLIDDRDEDDDDDDVTSSAPTNRPKTEESRLQAAAELFVAALRRKARGVALGRARVAGRAGRVLEVVGDRLPPEDDLASLGAKIANRADARTVVQSPRRFVMAAPAAYARFRTRAIRDGQFFRTDVTDLVRQATISGDEVDVLILTMLRNARRLLEAGRWSLASPSNHEWLESIRMEHLTQVFVDEATDFSTVQLACTMELSHPRLRSWFACGDFNQRITENGLRDKSEIEWLSNFSGEPIDMREVRVAYRQSRRLRELAADLSGDSDAGTTDSPNWGDDADVWPLLAENCTGDGLAAWLAERIVEVESSTGRLPSVAVFVDGEERIDALVGLLSRRLAPQNVRVVGCRDGRDVGDELEVRVFDVRHIKGLEFEAVFFVGIDRLAERLPALFDRFFYVGVSRAATYLGVTCEGHLPAGLERVRRHFDTSGWQPA